MSSSTIARVSCIEMISRLHSRVLTFSVCRQCARQSSTVAVAAKDNRRSKLISSVCLQRYPVISTPLSKFEKQYEDFLRRYEDRNSLLSDFELQMIKDEQVLKERKGQKKKDLLETKVETSSDKLSKWNKELESFTAAPRVTEADDKNDERSLNRQLDKSLVLIVKKKVGNKDIWTLPHADWSEGESMRQTAERALAQDAGTNISHQFLGNAPLSYYQYKLPPNVEEEENVSGAKVFLFKAVYTKGNVTIEGGNVQDYKWVTKSELKTYIEKRLFVASTKACFDL